MNMRTRQPAGQTFKFETDNPEAVMMTSAAPPADRLREVAAVFAAGVLRMRRPAAEDNSEIRPESPETCLELHAPTVLTVPTFAVNSLRDKEIRRRR